MNVIAFNKLEHDVTQKPVPTFWHHALVLLSQKRLSLKAAGCGGFDIVFVWLLSAVFDGWSIADANEPFIKPTE